MLIKFGSVIVDSRGTIGGHTIKMTRAGLVMQTKTNPPSRQTQRTSIARSTFAAYSKMWYSTLTVGQRNDWRALAAANPLPNTWGDEFPLAGIAFFIRTNLTLYAVGEPPLMDAPANQNVTAIATVTLTVTAPATATVAFTPTPTPANHLLLIKATPEQSPGRENFSGQFFVLAHGADAEASPFDIATAYTNYIGNFKTGRAYAVEATFINTETGARAAPIISAALAS